MGGEDGKGGAEGGGDFANLGAFVDLEEERLR